MFLRYTFTTGRAHYGQLIHCVYRCFRSVCMLERCKKHFCGKRALSYTDCIYRLHALLRSKHALALYLTEPWGKRKYCAMNIYSCKEMYKVRLICIVFRGSLTGLHPHVLQIHQTVGNKVLFQQDIASIPAIWQGTVCKQVMSYPLNWPSGFRSISDRLPLGYSRPADT